MQATSPEVAHVSGRYFDKSRAKKSSEPSYDRAAAERLWAVSGDMTKVAA